MGLLEPKSASGGSAAGLEATRLLQMTADGLYDTSTALEEVFLLSSLQAGSRASTTRQLDEEGLDLKDGLTIQLCRVQDVGSLLCSIVVGDEASIERAEVVVAILLEELLHLPRHIGLAKRVSPEAERDVGEDGLRREDFAYEGVVSRDVFAGLEVEVATVRLCLLYTSPSPRDS